MAKMIVTGHQLQETEFVAGVAGKYSLEDALSRTFRKYCCEVYFTVGSGGVYRPVRLYDELFSCERSDDPDFGRKVYRALDTKVELDLPAPQKKWLTALLSR